MSKSSETSSLSISTAQDRAEIGAETFDVPVDVMAPVVLVVPPAGLVSFDWLTVKAGDAFVRGGLDVLCFSLCWRYASRSFVFCFSFSVILHLFCRRPRLKIAVFDVVFDAELT